VLDKVGVTNQDRVHFSKIIDLLTRLDFVKYLQISLTNKNLALLCLN